MGNSIRLSEKVQHAFTIYRPCVSPSAPPGAHTLLRIADFVSSKLLMPICGLLSCIFIARRWGREAFVQANSNGGTLPNQALLRKVFFVLTRITPVLIAVVMGYGLVG